MPFGELLEQQRVAAGLVTLHRERLTSTRTTGVVRVFSKRLVLVEAFADDGRPAGFTLLRREDITRLDRGTEPLRRLLQATGPVGRAHPIAREVNPNDWPSALTSAQAVSPVLRLHREGIGDPIALASPSIKLLKHLVVGSPPDVDEPAEAEVALALDHLTRLDFA